LIHGYIGPINNFALVRRFQYTLSLYLVSFNKFDVHCIIGKLRYTVHYFDCVLKYKNVKKINYLSLSWNCMEGLLTTIEGKRPKQVKNYNCVMYFTLIAIRSICDFSEYFLTVTKRSWYFINRCTGFTR